jgi:hypothetical protein
MSWLKAIFGELLGLFIEDGSFAVAIVVWFGVVWFLLTRVPLPHRVQGPLLVAGLLAILLESVLRAARRR